MNRPVIFAFGAVIGCAAALHAQSTPAPATQPVAVSDVTIRPDDSPLVRSAKMAAAARASRRNGVIINDAYLKAHTDGKISQARAIAPPVPAPKPQMRAETDFPVIVPKPRNPVDPAALEKRQEALRQEQTRLAARLEDPNGGDSDTPDDAEKRLAQIAKEMEQIQQQLKKQQTQQPPNPRP